MVKPATSHNGDSSKRRQTQLWVWVSVLTSML